MRKITQDAIRAFYNRTNFKRGNTRVEVNELNESRLLLHGNTIAYMDETKILISNCGYFTNTTKERLNGLNGVNIVQKDFNWYLNGELWNGGKAIITPHETKVLC